MPQNNDQPPTHPLPPNEDPSPSNDVAAVTQEPLPSDPLPLPGVTHPTSDLNYQNILPP